MIRDASNPKAFSFVQTKRITHSNKGGIKKDLVMIVVVT
jgi:hypothetical protein